MVVRDGHLLCGVQLRVGAYHAPTGARLVWLRISVGLGLGDGMVTVMDSEG